jgi:hypothetical protein
MLRNDRKTNPAYTIEMSSIYDYMLDIQSRWGWKPEIVISLMNFSSWGNPVGLVVTIQWPNETTMGELIDDLSIHKALQPSDYSKVEFVMWDLLYEFDVELNRQMRIKNTY